MTDTTRLEKLQGFVRDRPRNAFAHYGLAMELLKLGKVDDALRTFDTLLSFDPLYTAAYYHAARALLETGRRQDGERMIARGMKACDEKGDSHTKEELQALLDAGA